MTNRETIWILEDDSGCQFVYRESLELRYKLRFFGSVEEFSMALSRDSAQADLIIADIRLPGMSFIEFLRSADTSALRGIPFIVVSSVDDIDVLRICYEKAASDYIVKPFTKSELIVKVERVLGADSLRKPDYDLDSISLTLSRGSRRTETLTLKEYQIASLLAGAKDATLPREAICRKIWGDNAVDPKTFDVHLSHLRKKLSPIGLSVSFISPSSYQLHGDGTFDAPGIGKSAL